jgi:transcription antitermination factor NusG
MNLNKNIEDPNWYAIFTKPRSEKKVHQRMLDQQIEAFLPLVKTVRQWSDRKKTVEVPLISSYVFVYLPENDLYKTLLLLNSMPRFIWRAKALVNNSSVMELIH